MGSYGTTMEKGQSMAQFMQAEVVGSYEMLASAVVRTGESARYGGWPEVFYAAAKVTNPESNDYGRIFAVVVPFVRGGKDWAGRTSITYKPMEEDMGPCESSCPERIMKLLTPTDSEWANQWRDRCREHAANLARVKALQPGQTILFENPMEFTDGFQADTFVALDPKKGLWRAEGGYGRYRISENALLSRSWVAN